MVNNKSNVKSQNTKKSEIDKAPVEQLETNHESQVVNDESQVVNVESQVVNDESQVQELVETNETKKIKPTKVKKNKESVEKVEKVETVEKPEIKTKQKGGKKEPKIKSQENTTIEAQEQKKPKKETKSKKNKTVQKLTTDNEHEHENENEHENEHAPELDDDNKTRSFKVQLPTETDFTGRFTGLTPYQAANKALSKYFRNNDNVNINGEEIIFHIKESTRGSKRSTYAYKGKRIKLEEAITYQIKAASGEERTIIKQYKNHLTKIKKGANALLATASAETVSATV
jgi:hypothetical protein